MAVMPRETWTDERLDDLKEGMNGRFDRVEAQVQEGFERAKAATDERFAQVDNNVEQVVLSMKEGFDRVDADIRELRGDIKGMQRLMIQGFLGICTLMLTGFGFIGFQ